MKLKEWRQRKGISQTFMAKELGITNHHLCGVEMGRYSAGRKLIKKIISFTNGEVTFEDLA